MVNLRKLATIIIFLASVVLMTPGRAQVKDDTTSRLLQKVRITFNQNDEHAFYEANANYRNYLLKQGDISGFYLSWKNEVLYDVNHNHFYRALRKTMTMQADPLVNSIRPPTCEVSSTR